MRLFTQIAAMLLVATLFSGANCFESCLFQFQQEIASATTQAEKPCHGGHHDTKKEAPTCAHREFVAEKQSSDGMSVKVASTATASVVNLLTFDRVVLAEQIPSIALGPPGPMRSPSRSVLRI